MPGSRPTNTLVARFKDEGRWDTIMPLREKLKSEGWTARQAYEHLERMFPPGQDLYQDGHGRVSWPQEPFRPLEINDPKGGVPAGEIPDVDWDSKGVVATRVSVDWVFEALGRKNVKPEDAPSAGAWALYQHAELKKDWFYQTYHCKTLPTRAQIDADSGFKDDGRGIIKVIDKLVDQNDK